MAIYTIPLSNAGDTKIRVPLGNNLFTIRTYYNPFIDIWCMDIADDNLIMDLKGINLVAGVNLLDSFPKFTRLFGWWRMDADAKGDTLGQSSNLHWFDTESEYDKVFPALDPITAPLTYDFDRLFRITNK